LDSSGSGYGSVARPCEHVNEHSIKGWKFLDHMTDNQLLSMNRLCSAMDYQMKERDQNVAIRFRKD
jgi:hypothetical protein